jgi:hypothetical protein
MVACWAVPVNFQGCASVSMMYKDHDARAVHLGPLGARDAPQLPGLDLPCAPVARRDGQLVHHLVLAIRQALQQGSVDLQAPRRGRLT